MIDFQGISNIFKNTGDAVTDIVSVAKNKLPPDQQIELVELENELKTNLLQMQMASMKQFQDFLIANEQPDKQPKWLIAWKGLIRPAFSSLIFLFLGFVFATDMMHVTVWKTEMYSLLITQIPTMLWAVISIVLGFYFGTQGVQRVMESMKN